MKHGKKPTRRQKELIRAARLNPDNWLVCRDTPEELTLEHRDTGRIRSVRKEAK